MPRGVEPLTASISPSVSRVTCSAASLVGADVGTANDARVGTEQTNIRNANRRNLRTVFITPFVLQGFVPRALTAESVRRGWARRALQPRAATRRRHTPRAGPRCRG